MRSWSQRCPVFSKQDNDALARRVSGNMGSAPGQPLGNAPVADLRAASLRAGGHRAATLSVFGELALKPQGVRK